MEASALTAGIVSDGVEVTECVPEVCNVTPVLQDLLEMLDQLRQYIRPAFIWRAFLQELLR